MPSSIRSSDRGGDDGSLLLEFDHARRELMVPKCLNTSVSLVFATTPSGTTIPRSVPLLGRRLSGLPVI